MSAVTGQVAMSGHSWSAIRLRKKIEEIQERAADNDGQISDANAAMMRMWQLQLEFGGRDQYIVIVPRNAIRSRNESAQGKIVSVKAEVAADKIAFSESRRERVRLATRDEIEAYEAYERAMTERQQMSFIVEQNRMRQLMVQSMIGTGVPMAGGAPSVPPPAPPTAAVAPDRGEDIDVAIPLAPDVPQPQTGSDQQHQGAVQSAGPKPPAPIFDERLREIGTAAQVDKLIAAGWTDVELVAAASPDDLAKIPGIGASRAASLIAAANEAVQEQTGDSPEGD